MHYVLCLFGWLLEWNGAKQVSLFHLLVQAGIILCCLGCAIFGITEVPTDGVEFDSGDQETGHDWGASQTEPPVIPVSHAHAASVATSNQYNPPAQGDAVDSSSGGWDPEKGEARKSFIEKTENKSFQSPAVVIPDSNSAAQPQQAHSTPVDLLDSASPAPAPQNSNEASFDLD